MPSYTISALPLATSAQLLIHNLTPDAHTPTVDIFRSKVLTTKPSIQRRARVCLLLA
jgi:serine/tyrosine/threonine adenylyltransferase